MEIKVKSPGEFQSLLTALAGEVVDASIHWKLLRELDSQRNDFSREFNQSATFWSLTLQAHLQTAVFKLIRIYDGSGTSLSLRNLLDTISANIAIFDTESFRERLKDNVFVDSLAEDARMPDKDQLEADTIFASNENDVVNRLTIWRNNFFAHKDAKNVLAERDITTEYPLNRDDLDALVRGSIEILNRYSSLFRAVTYSTEMIGNDDHMFVLESVRHKLRAMEREAEEKIFKGIGGRTE